MRFQRLSLPAFGPFTDLELSFPLAGHDFHVIYGGNEAGKSSLLRAIRDLLFGIHGQSPDNFLHPYKHLRLAGEIANRSGDRLAFQRRKGNKNTLLDRDGNPMPDSALLPFLGSVDQAYFSAMFGLGSTELREGARQLLRGEGEIGNALFSASMGGTPVQRVLESLTEESERFFKGRATANVSIRPAVHQYKELLGRSRELTVSPETWEQLETELTAHGEARTRLETELAAVDGDLNWIARCEDAMPSVARLAEATAELGELPAAPGLASDFLERAKAARDSLNRTRTNVQTLANRVAQLEEQLAECRAAPDVLEASKALDSLHQNLGAYRTRKEHLSDLQSKLAGIEPVLRAGMKNLGFTGDPASLEAARVDSAAWLQGKRVAESMQAATRDYEENREKTGTLKRNIEALENDLQSLPKSDLAPLRAALAIAAEATDAHKTLAASRVEIDRLTRDHGWTLVLAEWKGAGATEELSPGIPLEEAFPRSIAAADNLADQLREHAEAVAQAEEKRTQIDAARSRITAAQTRLADLRTALADCRTGWIAEWAETGLTPRSPDEMEEWRDAWTGFRDHLGRLKAARDGLKDREDRVARANQTLAGALEHPRDAALDDAFPVLYEAARSRVQHGEELTGRRQAIEEQLRTFRKQLESVARSGPELAREIETATEAWAAQCRAVGLPEGIDPGEGLDLLRERKDLIAKFDEWTVVSAEAQRTRDLIARYETAVREKAVQFGIGQPDTESREAALWEKFSQARKVQTRRDHLTEQAQSAGHEHAIAQTEETQAAGAFDALLELAGLTAAKDLEPLLANLEKRGALRNRIDELRETIGGLARGQSVDDFAARVRQENADELNLRRSRLTAAREEKRATLQTIQEAWAECRKRRADLESAGDSAADLRQQAESVAAALKTDASRFMRLRLAAHFLRAQIERFREEHQGPLLERSGEVFKRMTLGAFDGLGAEFNSEDVPILVGRRADGSVVPVEGMSDGSRDQLFLALRIAALDHHLERHEPMPLILDDLLITFDDARAGAILIQLADLSRRTQIFLFTHHRHLVELCRSALSQDQFHLHALDGSMPQ